MVADLLPKEVGALLTGAAGTDVVITYEPFDVENKGEIKVRESRDHEPCTSSPTPGELSPCSRHGTVRAERRAARDGSRPRKTDDSWHTHDASSSP